MKFLVVSQRGDGLGLAFKLREEGHDVAVQLRDKTGKQYNGGLLRKVDKFESILAQDTIVIFDSIGGGKTAERLRGQGYAVLGGSMFADQLADADLALGLMEEAGIPYGIPIAAEFNEVISTEGWFDGVEFARPFIHSIEARRLMNNDLGALADCVGSVSWACAYDSCKVVDEGLRRFAPILRHHGFVGPISLESTAIQDGVYGILFQPTFSYSFPAVMEMFTEGLGDTLAKYARAERVATFPVKDKGFGAALKVSIPPYPLREIAAPEGLAIGGLVRADRAHSYFYNVMLDKDATLRTSGGTGAIAAFTGYGDDIRMAMAGPMAIAERVQLSAKQFRTDLADVFERIYSNYLRLADIGSASPSPVILS